MDNDLIYKLFVKLAEMGTEDGRDIVLENESRDYKGNTFGTLAKREESTRSVKMSLYTELGIEEEVESGDVPGENELDGEESVEVNDGTDH